MQFFGALVFLLGSVTLLSSCVLGVPHGATAPLLGALIMIAGLLMRLIHDVNAATKYRQAPRPATHVKCPDCREFVFKDATRCPHCQIKLTPQD